MPHLGKPNRSSDNRIGGITRIPRNGKQLFEASRNGELEQLKNILSAGNVDVNWADAGGCTPLYTASQEGHKNVVEFLLKNGADVNKEDKYSRTPLYVSSERGEKDVIEILLRYGAKVDKADKDGQTPLYLASAKNKKDVVEILMRNGAKVEKADRFGETPLQAASNNGHKDVVEILLRNGVKVDEVQLADRTTEQDKFKERIATIKMTADSQNKLFSYDIHDGLTCSLTDCLMRDPYMNNHPVTRLPLELELDCSLEDISNNNDNNNDNNRKEEFYENKNTIAKNKVVVNENIEEVKKIAYENIYELVDFQYISFRSEDLIYGSDKTQAKLFKGLYSNQVVEEVVIKCFDKSNDWSVEDLEQKKKDLEREAIMLEKFKGKLNFVHYQGVSFSEKHTSYFGYIVFESLICSVQDLILALNPNNPNEKLLTKKKDLNLTEIELQFWKNEMIVQCSSALAFVHLKGIIHRDIKSANILISRDSFGRILFKISDFGISINEDEISKFEDQSCGTRGYMSPEIRSKERCQYSRLSDVYAFAVTVNEVMKGEITAGNEEKPVVFEAGDYDGRCIREFVEFGLMEDWVIRGQKFSDKEKYKADDDVSYFSAIHTYLKNKIRRISYV